MFTIQAVFLLFDKFYNADGKIDDDLFGRMSRQYTDEQRTIAEKVKELRAELDTQSIQTFTADNFIAVLKHYSKAKSRNSSQSRMARST